MWLVCVCVCAYLSALVRVEFTFVCMTHVRVCDGIMVQRLEPGRLHCSRANM